VRLLPRLKNIKTAISNVTNGEERLDMIIDDAL
jgi:hypothetical protein